MGVQRYEYPNIEYIYTSKTCVPLNKRNTRNFDVVNRRPNYQHCLLYSLFILKAFIVGLQFIIKNIIEIYVKLSRHSSIHLNDL